MNQLPQNLLTTGELAKLAHTTNRTVRWYVQKGIISPHSSNEKGYRFYTPEQVIDFQVLMLMRRFGFSLEEMKGFTGERSFLKKFFSKQRQSLKDEVAELTKSLKDIDEYYNNLKDNGTIVRPIVKELKPIEIFFLEKEGPYSKIKKYDFELSKYFDKLPKDVAFLTIFLENEFRPKKAKMKIGIIKTKDTLLKSSAEKFVKKEVLPKFKALVCKHNGSSEIVSLLWQEMLKYMNNEKIKMNTSLSFANLEFYRNVPSDLLEDVDNIEFELVWPIY